VPAFDDDDIAAPLVELQAAVQQTASVVREAFADSRCQLLWKESTFGRLHSLAALSHQCVLLEQMSRLASANAPSEVIALLARHHLETWVTGLYLLVGGEEALEQFFGADTRAQAAMVRDIEALKRDGLITDFDLTHLSETSGWEAAHFQYEGAFREVDKVVSELGLVYNVRSLYVFAYRSLSANLGAHPTVRVLDRYIDSSRGFARVEAEAQDIRFRRRAIQLAVVLTSLHAVIALGSFGCPLESYVEVLGRLRPPEGLM
jgi:hypothetical protein